MNKEQLVTEIARNAGVTKAIARKTLNATLDAIEGALRRGEPIQLVGFGSFVIIQRKERRGRNPRTGEIITIPGKRVVRFRPGKRLKEAVQ